MLTTEDSRHLDRLPDGWKEHLFFTDLCRAFSNDVLFPCRDAKGEQAEDKEEGKCQSSVIPMEGGLQTKKSMGGSSSVSVSRGGHQRRRAGRCRWFCSLS